MFIYGTQIHKVLVVDALSSTTVREINQFFYYMQAISFKIINKHCLNLMQKAFFFTDIYRMVNFARICLQLNSSRFQENSDAIFEFLQSKSIPRGIFNTVVVLSRSYLRKFSICHPPPSLYHQFVIFKKCHKI